MKNLLFATTACLLCASIGLAEDRFYSTAAAANASQWVTGCCDHQPMASDHLWDDYCAEQAAEGAHHGHHFGIGGKCAGPGCGIPACSRWRPRNTGSISPLALLQRRHVGACGSSCEMPVAAACADAAPSVKLAPRPQGCGCADHANADALPAAPRVLAEPPVVDSVPVVPVPKADTEDLEAPFQPEAPSELELPE